MKTQIKAIKKEVQQKVANLSPVLKKTRGQSKPANNIKSSQQPQNAEVKETAVAIKYKSPLRTTLKSASSPKVVSGVNSHGIATKSQTLRAGPAAQAQQHGQTASIKSPKTNIINNPPLNAANSTAALSQHLQLKKEIIATTAATTGNKKR